MSETNEFEIYEIWLKSISTIFNNIGKNETTRKVGCENCCKFAKEHPDRIGDLLNYLMKLLSSEEFVIRQSTCKAIASIIRITLWILQPDIKVPQQNNKLLYACPKEKFAVKLKSTKEQKGNIKELIEPDIECEIDEYVNDDDLIDSYIISTQTESSNDIPDNISGNNNNNNNGNNISTKLQLKINSNEILQNFLNDENWIVRQGSAMLILELLKIPVFSSCIDYSSTMLCEYILLIICRDNFSDYSSEIMITPVRGLLSEILSLLLVYVNNDKKMEIIMLLLEYLDNSNNRFKNWQIFHSLLQCLYYIIPLNRDNINIIMERIDVITRYLINKEDDIRLICSRVLLLLPIPVNNNNNNNNLLLNSLNESLSLINEFTPSFQYIFPYYIKYIIHNLSSSNNNKKTRKTDRIIDSFNSIGISSFIILIHHNMFQIRYNVIEIMKNEIEKLLLFCEITNEIQIDLLNHIVYCIIIEMDMNISNSLFEIFEKLLKYVDNNNEKDSVLKCLFDELYYYIYHNYNVKFDRCFIQIPKLPSSDNSSSDNNNIEWYYIGNKINTKDNIQKYSRFLSILTSIYSDQLTIYNQFITNMMLNHNNNYYILYTIILSFLLINDYNQIPLSFLDLILKYEYYNLSYPLDDSDVIKQLKIDIKEVERFKNEKQFPDSIRDDNDFNRLIETINKFCESFEDKFNEWKNNQNIKKEIILIHSKTIIDLKDRIENHMKLLHNEITICSYRIRVIVALICLKREINIQQNIKTYYSNLFEYIIYENNDDINYIEEYTTKIIELLNNNKYKNANETLIRNVIYISCYYDNDEYKYCNYLLIEIFDKCDNLLSDYPFILGLISGIKQIDDILSTKLSFRLITTILRSKNLSISIVTQIFHFINQLILNFSSLDNELKFMIISSFSIGIWNYYHIIISLFTYELLDLLDINNDNGLVYFLLEIISLFFSNEEVKDNNNNNNNENINENSIVYIVIYIPKLFPFFAVSDNNIRSVSSKLLKLLIPQISIEYLIKDPEIWNEYYTKLSIERVKNRNYLYSLNQGISSSSLSNNNNIILPSKYKLRKYQIEGIKWMMYLINELKCNGILADEMGLGKTVQVISMIVNCNNNNNNNLPTLIICPEIMIDHWYYEIEKFYVNIIPNVLLYKNESNKAKRQNVIKCDLSNRIIITSYDVIQKDIEIILPIEFNIVVLDEGQHINNPSSRLAIAVKQLKTKHKLIVSGTPIQNSPLELWSLFDFILPDYLGTVQEFKKNFYEKIKRLKEIPITDEKKENGTLALNHLHSLILPFILRRSKETVLSDLPPKLIKDVYCEMSMLQSDLYKESNLINNNENSKKRVSIFSLFQIYRLLCIHPILVLNSKYKEYFSSHSSKKMKITEGSGKIDKLTEILNDLDYGEDSNNSNEKDFHKIIIFAQTKSIILFLETYLKLVFPHIPLFKVDGTVLVENRFKIIQQYKELDNNKKSILLASTIICGEGIDLSCSDIAIFIEHDWNPIKDIQAMDRIHRIGQTKPVTIYRLIMKNTIEENIVSLQQFKLDMMNSIITRDNSSIDTMFSNSILNLIVENYTKNSKSKKSKESALQEILKDLESKEATDEEYDDLELSNFLSGVIDGEIEDLISL